MLLLYPSTETAFTDNGLGALSDAISCQVTEARNGEYELSLAYPITGIHYNEIKARCIITAKPNPYADPQPFRIYRITRPLGGRVTIYAQHISYDLSGVTVSPFTASSVTGAFAEIAAKATDNNGFSFWTDSQDTGEMTVAVPSSVRSILGGTEGSVLDTYGGEYEWDGFTVRLWSRRGQNSGVTIRYGKNLTSLEQDENIAGVATGVYPYWAGEDGALVTLPEKTVDAPGTYDFIRVVPLDLSSEFETAPSTSQLRERAEKYVEDNDIGVPTVSITVAFCSLDQTEEYKDIALLERVNLCDTVTVEYPALGVSATAKCVKTVYDALKGRYINVELGDAKTNLADTIIQQQKEIEKVPTTSIMKQAITNATNIITGNKGGYVVLRDSNGDEEPDEILIMDKPDIETAQKVWRWNTGGLGYSSTGINGPYGTAITMDGSIVASYITTGILNASLIKTGRISSPQNPNAYVDLDAGEISASALSSQDYPDISVAIGPPGDGADEGALNVIDGGKNLMSVYVAASGSEDGAIWTAPAFTASAGQRKGIAIWPGSIKMFADSGGVSHGVSVDSDTGETDIDGGLSVHGDTTFTAPNNVDVIVGGLSTLYMSVSKISAYRPIDMNGNDILNQSDRRLKTHIAPCTKNALDIIQKLKLYEYDWKKGGHVAAGLIAQQVEEIAPELVHTDDAGKKSIKTLALIPYLIKAIQELAEDRG